METVLWISADGPLSTTKDSVETKSTDGHDNLFLIMKCILTWSVSLIPPSNSFQQLIINILIWILEKSFFSTYSPYEIRVSYQEILAECRINELSTYRWGAGDNSCLMTYKSTHKSGSTLISRIPRDPYSGKYCSSSDVLELCGISRNSLMQTLNTIDFFINTCIKIF